MNGRSFWTTLSILTMGIVLSLIGCAEIRLNTLPSPPPTAKLRVFVLPITSTSHPAGGWPVSEKTFFNKQYQSVSRMLQLKGFYQVIPRDEVAAILGNQDIEGWRWSAGNWKLAKDVGRTLHADYINIFERKASERGVFSAEQLIISLSSGRIYRESVATTTISDESVEDNVIRVQKMNQDAYRKLFLAAKGDMFATALRKGKAVPRKTDFKAPVRTAPVETVKPPAPTVMERTEPTARPQHPERSKPSPASPVPAEKASSMSPPPADPGKDRIPAALQAMIDQQPADGSGRSRLVVYDFDAGEQYGVVAMILSEALREELHELGKFLLVNRENIVQVMDELKLQQSGLMDENQAIQLGKWLAANETVTGNLAQLGNLFILQAKRTDIQTLGTLGIGSLKTSPGKEEELLNGLPALARKLAGLP